MKYLKKFEKIKYISISEEVEIGDYILVHYKKGTLFGGNNDTNEEIINYLNNNVAQIISFSEINTSYATVIYDTKPSNNIIRWFVKITKNKKKLYTKTININFITDISKTKEDIETKLAAQKYNLL